MSLLVFISYAHEDENFALRLASDLKAQGISVWIDKTDIVIGESWPKAIERALNRCTHFLIILSPDAINSEEVFDELNWAIDNKKYILPVKYKECRLPLRISSKQYIDFVNTQYHEAFERLRSFLAREGVVDSPVQSTHQDRPPTPVAIAPQTWSPAARAGPASSPVASASPATSKQAEPKPVVQPETPYVPRQRTIPLAASHASLAEMINSSIVVLSKPSIATFEMFERRGETRDALAYITAAAIFCGAVAFLIGLITSVETAIIGLISSILLLQVNFLVGAYTLFFFGRAQGGVGTRDEVFYSCALYSAPTLAIGFVIGSIPIQQLSCVIVPATFMLSIYQIYMGYLALRSSMILDPPKAIIGVIVTVLAQIGINFLMSVIIAPALDWLGLKS